jgi:hypothetical protein
MLTNNIQLFNELQSDLAQAYEKFINGQNINLKKNWIRKKTNVRCICISNF